MTSFLKYLSILFFSFLGWQQSATAQEEPSSVDATASIDTIIVGYTKAAPFIITDQENLEGISIWLFENIAKELGLVYELRPMIFGEMIDALNEGTIDMSINPLTITGERAKHMDFSLPFYASHSTVAIVEHGALHKFLHLLTSVLSYNFLSAVLLLIIVIFIFGWIAWYFEHKENPAQFRTGMKGVWDGVWWSVVTMTTVGYGDKAPRSRGGKMIALIWMFSGLIFISGFTASIASSLTVEQLHSNFDNIADFKNKPIGCVKSTNSANFLRRNFFKNVTLSDELVDGLRLLKEDKVAGFIYDEPLLRYRISNDKEFEDLEIMPIQFNLQFYSFGFSNDRRELEKAVSQEIAILTESLEWRVLLSEYDLGEE